MFRVKRALMDSRRSRSIIDCVEVGACLVELLPAVTELVWDVKKEVKAAALDALEAICHCSGNKDLEVCSINVEFTRFCLSVLARL